MNSRLIEIAMLVVEMTDDKSLPKAARKRLQIEHAEHMSHDGTLVKLADKICNLRDVTASPPAGWSLGAGSKSTSIGQRRWSIGCRG
jgi:hypothetical protein